VSATAQADVAAYDGRRFLGAVAMKAGKHAATDSAGKKLGAFASRKAALAAVSDAARLKTKH
jgi:hypothetical protein